MKLPAKIYQERRNSGAAFGTIFRITVISVCREASENITVY
jgi:hypothetical protein